MPWSGRVPAYALALPYAFAYASGLLSFVSVPVVFRRNLSNVTLLLLGQSFFHLTLSRSVVASEESYNAQHF